MIDFNQSTCTRCKQYIYTLSCNKQGHLNLLATCCDDGRSYRDSSFTLVCHKFHILNGYSSAHYTLFIFSCRGRSAEYYNAYGRYLASSIRTLRDSVKRLQELKCLETPVWSPFCLFVSINFNPPDINRVAIYEFEVVLFYVCIIKLLCSYCSH